MPQGSILGKFFWGVHIESIEVKIYLHVKVIDFFLKNSDVSPQNKSEKFILRAGRIVTFTLRICRSKMVEAVMSSYPYKAI